MTDTLHVLLDLQAHDTTLAQHRHRRATLPERADLAAQQKALAVLDAEIAGVAGEREHLAREQKRLEDDAASVEAKAAAEDKRLYGGTVTSAKELQAIQEEIGALQRRQSTLEDGVLELMVQIEPLDEQLAAFASQRAELQGRADALATAIETTEREIDAQIAAVEAERAALASSVPAPTLAEYDSLRQRLGGVAVAKLEGGSCRGCHLQLSAVELDRIRRLPKDAVVHCEECGRILVR
jgi:predicted  nucleic acid-binding Zn-ribbon protein